ncbi:MAG: molybdate ABC transporter substrate-binding protein [Acidimicrobiia bacterium]|nr:molybdate ABC transporter substrate-binding protein [Acidimicrobiia bacterium]
MLVRRCLTRSVAAALIVVAACSTPTDTTVDVYAASSLTDAFGQLETSFEAENPGVDIRLNLAGSNALQRQILDGAGADVFAPADLGLLDGVADHVVGEGAVYASNRLTMVVPAGVDGPVRSPADLTVAGVLVARCAAGVPCGDATDRYLATSGLSLAQSTDEPNVRAVLLKVARGEADAGFVYATDALVRPADVAEIALPGAPTVDLAVALLSDDADAEAFARYVTSAAAGDIFRNLGFVVP